MRTSRLPVHDDLSRLDPALGIDPSATESSGKLLTAADEMKHERDEAGEFAPKGMGGKAKQDDDADALPPEVVTAINSVLADGDQDPEDQAGAIGDALLPWLQSRQSNAVESVSPYRSVGKRCNWNDPKAAAARLRNRR